MTYRVNRSDNNAGGKANKENYYRCNKMLFHDCKGGNKSYYRGIEPTYSHTYNNNHEFFYTLVGSRGTKNDCK